MKRLTRILTSLAASAALLTALMPFSPAAKAQENGDVSAAVLNGDTHWVNNHVLAKPQYGVDPGKIADAYGLKLSKHLFEDWYLYETEPDAAYEVYKQLYENKELVSTAELDFNIAVPASKAELKVNLSFCQETICPQWYNKLLNVEKAWEKTKGSSQLMIAMLGTGVDFKHPMLEGRLLEGYNFAEEGSLPQDDNGLGTWEAGAAAGSMLEGSGIAGVDLEATVLPVKIFDKDGMSSLSTLIQGMVYAKEKGANVMHVSAAHAFKSLALKDLIAWCGNDGVRPPIIIFPNPICKFIECPPKLDYDLPVEYDPNPDCIRCGPIFDRIPYHTGIDERINPSEEWAVGGLWAHLAVPTERIFTADLGGGLAQVSSSSMGSALLAGAMTLTWSINPEWSSQDVIELLGKSANPIEGTGKYFNNGALDVYQAVTW